VFVADVSCRLLLGPAAAAAETAAAGCASTHRCRMYLTSIVFQCTVNSDSAATVAGRRSGVSNNRTAGRAIGFFYAIDASQNLPPATPTTRRKLAAPRQRSTWPTSRPSREGAAATGASAQGCPDGAQRPQGRTRSANYIQTVAATARWSRHPGAALESRPAGGQPNEGKSEYAGTGAFLMALNAGKNAAGDQSHGTGRWMTIRSGINNDKCAPAWLVVDRLQRLADRPTYAGPGTGRVRPTSSPRASTIATAGRIHLLRPRRPGQFFIT
jgi:hypothetical protein